MALRMDIHTESPCFGSSTAPGYLPIYRSPGNKHPDLPIFQRGGPGNWTRHLIASQTAFLQFLFWLHASL